MHCFHMHPLLMRPSNIRSPGGDLMAMHRPFVLYLVTDSVLASFQMLVFYFPASLASGLLAECVCTHTPHAHTLLNSLGRYKQSGPSNCGCLDLCDPVTHSPCSSCWCLDPSSTYPTPSDPFSGCWYLAFCFILVSLLMASGSTGLVTHGLFSC